MDSPIRQQLKRNDYQRHKLFRKMARRRKAKKEQELKAAEKELKRKLRIPKYEDGKPTDTTWMSNWLTKRADKILENMGDIPSETFDRFNTATALQQLLNLLGTIQKTVQEVENKAGVGKFNGRTDIKSNPRTITIAADAPAQTVVHELTHALASPTFGGMEDSLPQHQKISLIYKEDGVHSVAPTTTKDGRVIPPDIRAQLEKYINSPEEIYGRLNELRYGLGLNPTYIVTPEDVLKWRAAGKFDRFWRDVPDSTILRLFNEVAQQAVPIRDDGVYVAKDGKGAYGNMKRLKKPKYADGKGSYPDLKRLVLGDEIQPLYEWYLEQGMSPDDAMSSVKRHYDSYVKNNIDGNYESFYAGSLPEVVVKPDPNEKYNVSLITHYPSKEWPIGHSELVTPGGNSISAGFHNKAYNLAFNNCSDATASALAQAFGTSRGWHLINTPGDTKDFAEKKLGGTTLKNWLSDTYIPGQYYAPAGVYDKKIRRMKGSDITLIPATVTQLQSLANFAKKLLHTGKYADGKPKYNIRTNDGTTHNFSFDEQGNTVLDDGSVGNLLLDNVIVRPGVDVRQAIERKMDRLAKQSEMVGFTDPISGEYHRPQGGPLKSVYPEFDLITLWLIGGPLLRQSVERLLQNRTPSLGKPIINESFSQVPSREINVGAETTATPEYTDLLKREELGKYVTEGGESTVYENDFFPGEVIKEKEGLFAPAKDFEELQAHINNDLLQNKLPNVVPLRYRGYVHDPSTETLVRGNKIFKRTTERFNPVYSLKKITPATEMADPWHVIFKNKNKLELSDYYILELERLGYILDSNGFWNVKGFPYKVGDLGPNNVGYDDFGNMLIFDPLIHYKYGKASGIHIKPENRGKFTALKKRTGKSASWFKEHGTPALKKMATFALNARKWKHKYEYGKALGDPPSGRRPLTFLGSVAKNITGSDSAALWTDGASGVLGFIPGVGTVITALDLGHDVNDLVHGDGATWSDVAWDVAGAIPFLKKGRKALKMLKKEKQLATSNRLLKKIDNLIKLWQDKKRAEDIMNYGLWTPKLGDAVSDAK